MYEREDNMCARVCVCACVCVSVCLFEDNRGEIAARSCGRAQARGNKAKDGRAVGKLQSFG